MKWYELLKAWGTKQAGEKIQLEEADGTTLVESGFAKEVEGDPLAGSISEALVAFHEGMVEVVKDVTTSIVKELQGKTGEGNSEGGNVTDVKDARIADPMGGFKSDNELFSCVKAACRQEDPVVDDRLKLIRSEQAKAPYGNNESSGEDGGFLLVPDVSNRILERAREQLNILGSADVLSLAGNSLIINGFADDDKNAAAVRHAGMIVYWVGEAKQITRSSLKFRQITMRLHKMAALAFVTDEELEDAPINFGARLTDKAGEAIGDELNEVFMFGTGVGQPLGAFKSDAAINVAKQAGQAADTIVFENILEMQKALWSRSFGKSVWYYNQELIPQLATMTMQGGTSSIPVYLPVGGVSEPGFQSLYGRPALVTDHAAALGDEGDLLMADWSQYLVATKGSVKTAMSIHLRFDYDETAFKFTYRVDGRPAWEKTMRPRKGASAFRVSPFLKLAART